MTQSQVLARKWRPRTFSELVGQAHVVRALSNALDTARLHHAWLLTGTRGVGKTTLARILAKCLNCETGVTSNPCGVCAACRDIDAGRFPDLLEVDAATNTRVEEMRELLDTAQYMPVAGRYKVYIIDEVHMLSRSAFNSMLKTLEEPPEHVKFILATTDPQKVPVTVLSRCLQFNLKQMPPDLIVSRLSYILEQEAIPFEPGALALIAQAARGSMRDSLSLLDQAIAYGGGRVEQAPVADMLGVIGRDYLYDILRALAGADGAALMQAAERMAERSVSFDTALEDLASLLQEAAILAVLPGQREMLGFAPEIEPFATAWDGETLQLLYQIAVQGRRDLSLAPDEFSGFRMTLLRMLAFQPQAAAPRAAAPPLKELPVRAPRSEPALAPAPKAQPAPKPASHASQPPPSPGDWPDMVRRLAGSGIAYELARNCEMVGYADGLLRLHLDPAQKSLARYKEQLRAELEALLDASLRVTVEVGEITGDTVARADDRVQDARQKQAAESIRNDPFVQAVVGTLGGKLVESSIKPKVAGEPGDKG
jgi:DNA polymerase-3 subunit gamma/tau